MKQRYTKFLLLFLLVFSTSISYAQYTVSNLETGKQNAALARDASGNIYTTRFQAAGKYEIVKYTNGTGTPTVIHQNIVGDATDLPYGLAVASNGDIYFSAEMGVGDGKIVRLNASSSYAATTVQTGRFFTGLAFDNQNRLYALEYNSGASKYAVVRYNTPSVTNSSGTSIYANIKSGSGLSNPNSISVANDLTVFLNNVFDTDGSNPDQGGIIKLSTANNGVSYTKTDLNTTNRTSALFLDEFNNLYAIESVSSAPYKLYKYTNGAGTGVEFHATAFASSYPFLAYGVTAYNNLVYAIDGDDGVNGSRLVKLTPTDVTPPSVPTGLSAVAKGGSKITLTWTANNAAEGISGYRIYGGTTANPTQLIGSVPNGTITFTHTGLVNAQQYFYKISAVDIYFNEGTKTADQNATTAKPVITSATYNANTKVLTATGTNFLALTGATNDVLVSKLTLTAEGGITRTLAAADVEITSATTFSVTLNSADQTVLNTLINKNGLSSTGGTAYNLALANGWAAGEDASINTAQTTIPITVSNVPVPSITSAAYNAGAGVLTVTGTGLLAISGATNDIIANKFTMLGDGGVSYTLTDTPNGEVTSPTSFTLTLSMTDKAGVYHLFNKNGTASAGGTTYNLAVAEDWNAGADAAISIADLSNAVTVSNIDPVLPVTLVAFTATTSERGVILNWSTSSELNSDVFIVSKSVDGTNFNELETVKAAGNSKEVLNYIVLDKNPFAGISYYKLTQLDKDAKVAIEKVIVANYKLSADLVVIYPNPVIDNLNVKIADKRFKTAQFVDVNGKVLKSFTLTSNTAELTVDMSTFPKGVYLFKLIGDKDQMVRKVIKN